MLYRWPQGRILRVVAMIIVALIAFDFGRAAYGQWGSIAEAEVAVPLTAKVTFGILAAAALAVGAGGLYLVGFSPRAGQFLIEVEAEMGKVTWPAKNELIRLTIVIAVIAIVLTGLIAFVDWINLGIKNLIFYGDWGGI